MIRGLAAMLVLACRTTTPAPKVEPPRVAPPPSVAESETSVAEVEPPAYRTISAEPALCAIRTETEIVCVPFDPADARVLPIPDDLPEGERWVELATASDRICGLTAPSGQVRCWEWGRHAVSAEEEPGVTGAIDLAIGGLHGCVLYRDGAVGCWGNNDQGQLGDGTREQSPTPVRVPIAPARAVAASPAGSCALLQSGEIACWGSNPAPDDPRRLEPSTITGLSEVSELLPGHAAVGSDGAVWRWRVVNHLPEDFAPAKREERGLQEGRCTLEGGKARCAAVEPRGDRYPRPAMDIDGVVEVASGDLATCVRRNDQRVSCWGAFVHERRTGPTDRQEPKPVQGLSGAKRIGVGDAHACALLGSGEVKCWGDAWMITDETSGLHWSGTPATVPFGGKATDLVVASRFLCAAVAGRWKCRVLQYGGSEQGWPVREIGPLYTDGHSSEACRLRRKGLECASYYYLQRSEIRWHELLPGRAPVAIGATYTCLATPKGQLIRCHDGRATEDLDLGPSVQQLSAGRFAVCGLHKDGSITCGQIGYPRDYRERLGRDGVGRDGPPAGTGPAQAVEVGSDHACALLRSGKVACWNEGGEYLPKLDGLDGVTQLSVGTYTSCALRKDGSVWCWGSDSNGQLGTGGFSRTHVDRPTDIVALFETRG